MAETTKKSTTKKAAAKTTAKKSVPKKPAETKVVEPVVPQRTIELTTPILCKSVRSNDLIYEGQGGIRYEWNGYGDLRELPYQEVLSLKSRKSAFLYEPWLMILDEDLMARPDYQKDFADMYKLYEDFENPDAFFKKSPAEIRACLANAPRGLRDLIMVNARKYIDDGALDSISVINVIDDVLGTNLKMFLI